MDLAQARPLWEPDPGWLNTASYGLPPAPAADALQQAVEQWRHGRTDWKTWDASTHRARTAFAHLVGADPADIAIGSTVSQTLSIVAASLPPGARVLTPDIEFTSNVYPWQVAAHVDTAPPER